MLGLKGKLPDIYTELEINYFLLRRLLGVKTTDVSDAQPEPEPDSEANDTQQGKQAKVAKLTKNEVLMVNIGSTASK